MIPCDSTSFRLGPQSATDTAPALYFYHPDHLGSTAMVTNEDGHITQNVVYIPYGEVFVEERNGSWTSSYLFNAKELDEETGLYYYGARYLDPPGARWLSVDPMWEKYMGMSPYNYCAGNPVKLVDPDGRKTFNGMSDYNQYNEYTGERTLIDYIIKGTETDKENTDNIYEHGSSIAIEHNGDYIMPFQVKKHFELDEDILVLHSCNTGYGNDCFAENLSFEYPDRIIVAPSTDICWEVEYNNGVIEVTEKVSNIKDGKLGEWNIFQKGNKIGSFAGNEIPHKDLVKDTVKECNFKKKQYE
ncbi:MAG: hypothetical protein J6I79_08405 [Paludibacteraceae bacterium]|nr:hypothetical protein [Paludibacteraceae bacterium]